MNRHLRTLALALTLALPFPAGAQPDQAPVPVVQTGDRSVQIGLGKAEMVRLPRPVSDVLIANPAVADVIVKTPELVYVIGNAVGDTNAFFIDEFGEQILKLDIRVEMDISAVERALDHLLPGGAIDVRAVNNNLIVTGDVPSAAMMDDVVGIVQRFTPEGAQVVNRLSITGGDQVMIRVQVAEMRRSVSKALGFATFLQDGNVTAAAAGDSFPLTGFVQLDLSGGLFDALSLDIEALESKGLVRVLAEPNLTAMSGEAASFLAGGEFPFPVSVDDLGNVTVEYRPFGVGLDFTPLVLSDGRISLNMRTQVSSISGEGAVQFGSIIIPSLQTRRVHTTVELPSGGSLAIAGVLQNSHDAETAGVPGLMDLPVLGQLFRSTEFQQNETELVIIVTPYIVKAVPGGELAVPTQGYAAPTDRDLYLYGRLAAIYGAPSAPPALEGPIGFLLP